MSDLREKTVKNIGKYKVETFKDVEQDILKNMETGDVTTTGLPKSNVLYYALEGNNWCCVRPSGTEPKIRIYIGVKADSLENADKEAEQLKEEMTKLVMGE
jgi:phosphoglucomutase